MASGSSRVIRSHTVMETRSSRQQARYRRPHRQRQTNLRNVRMGRQRPQSQNRDGYRTMLKLDRQHRDRVWAVEGCNGIGRHIAQRLVADGETVVDVPAKLSARARVFDTGQGRKTDPVDAHSVAVAALRAKGLRQVAVDDVTVALRLLVDRRDGLGHARTDLLNRIHKLLLELLPGGAKKSASSELDDADYVFHRHRSVVRGVVGRASVVAKEVELARWHGDGLERRLHGIRCLDVGLVQRRAVTDDPVQSVAAADGVAGHRHHPIDPWRVLPLGTPGVRWVKNHDVAGARLVSAGLHYLGGDGRTACDRRLHREGADLVALVPGTIAARRAGGQ
jgi:hypothetical protein